MRHRVVLKYACFVGSSLLFVAALYCLLWLVASSSMAFTDCAGSYDLFAANPRCRQPSIAGLLTVASLVLSAVLAFAGWRLRK
jgi:hypothetical protein